jgi:predicted RNA-binding Zn-ribbon protein involved in translation (DUF1610 family)
LFDEQHPCAILIGMSLVVVARFLTLGEAQAARSAVEAAGFFVRVADENVVGIEWLYSNAVGGVKLLVREDDREQVAELLAREAVEPSDQSLAGASEEAVAVSGGDAEDIYDEPAATRCPACGSAEIVEVPKLRIFVALSVVMTGVGVAVNEPGLALIGMAVVGLVLLVMNGVRCKACGDTWRGTIVSEPVPEAPSPSGSDTAGLLCPRCGRTELHYIHYYRLQSIPLLFVLTAVVVVPIWLLLPKKRCDHCGLRQWV